MAAVAKFRCEVCGTVSAHPSHWFIIQCNSRQLTVMKWDSVAAGAEGARHYCGEAHARCTSAGGWTRPAPRLGRISKVSPLKGISAIRALRAAEGSYDRTALQMEQCAWPSAGGRKLPGRNSYRYNRNASSGND
jgi:hypothetical protein